MFKNTSLASRLLLLSIALAALPLLWPNAVSAGWFGGLFHKKSDYDPVRTAPHCQQYYGHFPTCWRTWSNDFQNCPPGGFSPDGQMMNQQMLDGNGQPVQVPSPDAVSEEGSSSGEGAPAVPPVPYDDTESAPEPEAIPEPQPEAPAETEAVPPEAPAVEEAPAEEAPAEAAPELEVPAEAEPAAIEEDSSNLFFPTTPRQSAQRPSQWKATQEKGWRSRTESGKSVSNAGRESLIQLEGIAPPSDEKVVIGHSQSARKFPAVRSNRSSVPRATGKVAELLESIRLNDSGRRHESIYRLGLMGEEAAAAVPALTALLKDSDGKARMHAALALWRITQQTEFAVPTLRGGLVGEESSVKSLAAVALGEIGPPAKDAVPTLVSASEEADSAGKVQAAEALWKVAGKNANSIAVLVKALTDQDVEVRWVAAYALAEIAPRSRVVVRSLTRRLSDENAGVREVSAFALGAIGTTAKSSVPALLEAMTDKNSGVRDAATRALLLIDP